MLLFFILWWSFLLVPKLFGSDVADLLGFLTGDQMNILTSKYLSDLGYK